MPGIDVVVVWFIILIPGRPRLFPAGRFI